MYYLEQLRLLVSRLERQRGPLDIQELKRRVKQGQKIAALLQQIYDLRAMGRINASNARFYETARRGEYLHPDDFLNLLDRFLAESRGKSSHKGPAVVLSGVLPNPPEILSFLDELGVRIAHDDLLNCSRRFLSPPSLADDPFEALTEIYFGMPPCSTKDFSVAQRLHDLIDKTRRCNAKGIIFYVVKFCEPELFDVPILMEEIKKKGLATMLIDVEPNSGLTGQLATRLEAFAEMIR
jgi:benzoyl-CoA reductase/2-hydroxyglutaryl-CoA dehydratase subunit BcrC/BadD/HgdB